ncbi:YheC/YheD family endospore coat-associated protein [Effusibacillus dendaii]|uniref:YheC/YheD family protein n=1 Tax=Effusibacillus dendaii TaxID=2743772 RepID=A0A7I8D6M1_9BACL|nr:YheC/YheD family protein [Effusibacillus dendaii]BCJ85735.1 hypothetical protein skT53_07200 [Effusibacillus dendaii]
MRCGGVSRVVNVLHPMQDNQSICSLSKDLLESFALYDGIRLHLYKKEGMLCLGPVFGIFANVRTNNGEVVGQQEIVFQRLLTMAREENLYAYIFGPQEIDSGKLRGYVLRRQNGIDQWELRDVPFPDVVYDQIITRKFEKQSAVKNCKKLLIQKLGIAYFNPGYFDKAQVQRWLTANEETRKSVPDTIIHRNLQQTADFVQRYKQVYIKPVHGSLGIGIIKLIQLSDGRFYYQIKTKKNEDVSGFGPSALKVLLKLQSRLKKKTYIVQEELSLKTLEGRPFDIRVVIQKDQSGTWRPTKSFCRIAQAGDITSNLSTGGDAMPLSKMLNKLYDNKEEYNRIRRKINYLAATVPNVIEKESGLQLGEIGLDIGIDTQGNVWIIEVNSKPWKKPITEKGSMDLVLRSFRRPLLYGKYLAGIS